MSQAEPIRIVVVKKVVIHWINPDISVDDESEYFAIATNGDIISTKGNYTIGSVKPFMLEDENLMRKLDPVTIIRLSYPEYQFKRSRIRY